MTQETPSGTIPKPNAGRWRGPPALPTRRAATDAAKNSAGAKEAKEAKEAEGSGHPHTAAPPARKPPESAAVPPPHPRPAVERDSTARSVLSMAPPWLVSCIGHGIALLLLALVTLPEVTRPHLFAITANVVEEEDLDEHREVPIEKVEDLELEQLSLEAVEFDPGAIALGDVASASVPADMSGQFAALDTNFDQIGALFGTEGNGMAEIGSQFKGAANFFGTKAAGRRFVFVVDNSNSMGNGKFETACHELVKAVDGLTGYQQFYVLFFSDTAYRLFHPKPAAGLVPASDSNKDRLRAWLYNVEMCLHTRGEEAMKAAFALQPDVIFILGDGAFTDKTEAMLTAPHNRRVVIHTVGMEVNQRGEQQLKSIAAANNGQYRLAAANPQAKLLARQNPIKRNSTRGPVWGITLPPK
jgi:hypothetical protein